MARSPATAMRSSTASGVTPCNLGDPAVVQAVLDQAGIDPAAFAARIADEAVKEQLKTYTEAAIARGIFGAPSFFVGDELFFGQDRLGFVEEALNGRSYL